MPFIAGIFFTCHDCTTRAECGVSRECSYEPSLAAVNAMAGFDDLPRSLRDILNYHTVNMIAGDKPLLTVLDLLPAHGEAALAAALTRALDTAAANPQRFQDVREQNVTQRDTRPGTLQKLRQRS